MVKESHTKGPDEPFTSQIVLAVNKVRSQKQRPNEERICHAVRQKYRNMSDDEILPHLEKAVQEGALLKVMSKGQSSYRDPKKGPTFQSRVLKVSSTTDLRKYIVRAIKDLNDPEGSTIKSIEKYLTHSYSIDLRSEITFLHELKNSAKEVVEDGHVIQDGKLFRLNDESGTSTDGEDSYELPIVDMAMNDSKVGWVIFSQICILKDAPFLINCHSCKK